MRFKKDSFTSLDVEPRVVKAALKLAKCYKNLLKGTVSIYSNPFKSRVPLELQSVFKHFVKTAEVVIEEGANPALYMRAQFERFRRYHTVKRFAFPFPAQLYSANARLSYMEYMHEREMRKSQEVQPEDVQVDEYELQAIRLRQLRKAYGLSEAEVLQMFKGRFTKPFLRMKRVLK